MQLWETVQDSWDQDAEARLTAGCIAERIQNLGRQYPPSSDDPARALPSLSSTSSINTSSASTASAASSAHRTASSPPPPPANPLPPANGGDGDDEATASLLPKGKSAEEVV